MTDDGRGFRRLPGCGHQRSTRVEANRCQLLLPARGGRRRSVSDDRLQQGADQLGATPPADRHIGTGAWSRQGIPLSTSSCAAVASGRQSHGSTMKVSGKPLRSNAETISSHPGRRFGGVVLDGTDDGWAAIGQADAVIGPKVLRPVVMRVGRPFVHAPNHTDGRPQPLGHAATTTARRRPLLAGASDGPLSAVCSHHFQDRETQLGSADLGVAGPEGHHIRW